MQNLEISYGEAGRRDDSIKVCEEVLAIRRKVNGPEHPDTLGAMNDLASTLATSDSAQIRNGTNAVRLAEETVAATHRTNAGFLDTLAAAYAETGQFEKAVADEQEALGLPDPRVTEGRLRSGEHTRPRVSPSAPSPMASPTPIGSV